MNEGEVTYEKKDGRLLKKECKVLELSMSKNELEDQKILMQEEKSRAEAEILRIDFLLSKCDELKVSPKWEI